MRHDQLGLLASLVVGALAVVCSGCTDSDDPGAGAAGAGATAGSGGVGGSGAAGGGGGVGGAAGGTNAHVWSKRFGDSAPQGARYVAVDGSDNVVLVGGFLGEIDFGGGALVSADGPEGGDVFVAKLDSDGNHLWSKAFGDAAKQGAFECITDPVNDVFVSGTFSGTVDFGGGPLTSAGGAFYETDIFLAKFDSDGNHLWSQRYGDADDEFGSALAVDDAGYIIQTGYFAGTIDFGGGALVSAGGSDLWAGADVFLAKLDPDGNHVWSQRFGDAAEQYGAGVAVDDTGNVVIVGDFDGEVDFGGGPLTGDGGEYGGDVFVAKLDADGNHLWSKGFGDEEPQGTRGLAVDGYGNIVIIGSFRGEVDFGGGPLTSAAEFDTFVVKLAPNGDHLWSGHFGGPGRQFETSVAIDSSGDIAVVGAFLGTPTYDGEQLTSAGGEPHGDVFVLQFEEDGSHRWSRGFGDEANQLALGVAADSSRALLVAGEFEGEINFGGNTLTSSGNPSVFLAKLAP